MTTFIKDPSAVLDYSFDWSAWLAEGETISTATITATGLTVSSQSILNGVVTFWLSGGIAGTGYSVSCLVVTSAGRTDERTIKIECDNR
jgi:hypothetical protein